MGVDYTTRVNYEVYGRDQLQGAYDAIRGVDSATKGLSADVQSFIKVLQDEARTTLTVESALTRLRSKTSDASDAHKVLARELQNYIKECKDAEVQTSRLEQAFGKLALRNAGGGKFSGLLGAAGVGAEVTLIVGAVAAATAAIAKIVTSTAEAGQGFKKLSEETGLSYSEVQKFSYAAQIAGDKSGLLVNAIKTLSKGLAEGGEEGKRQKKTLDELGVGYQDSAGHLKSMGNIVAEVGDKLGAMSAGPLRNLYANDLFGKGGIGLIDTITHLRELGVEVTKTGAIMSDEGVESADKFERALTRLRITAEGTGYKIGQAFIDAIDAITDPDGLDGVERKKKAAADAEKAKKAKEDADHAASVSRGTALYDQYLKSGGGGKRGDEEDLSEARKEASRLGAPEKGADEATQKARIDAANKVRQIQARIDGRKEEEKYQESLARFDAVKSGGPGQDKLDQAEETIRKNHYTGQRADEERFRAAEAALREQAAAGKEYQGFRPSAGSARFDNAYSDASGYYALASGLQESGDDSSKYSLLAGLRGRDGKALLNFASVAPEHEDNAHLQEDILKGTHRFDTDEEKEAKEAGVSFEQSISRTISAGDRARGLNVLQSQGRITSASLAGPGQEQAKADATYRNRLAIAEQIRDTEISGIDQTLSKQKQLEEAVKATEEYKTAKQKAEIDHYEEVLELQKKQEDEFSNTFAGAVLAGQQGSKSIRSFGIGLGTKFESTVLKNAGDAIFESSGKDAQNAFSLTNDPNSFLGKLFKGTFLGPHADDPLTQPAIKLSTAGSTLDEAGKQLIAAAAKIYQQHGGNPNDITSPSGVAPIGTAGEGGSYAPLSFPFYSGGGGAGGDPVATSGGFGDLAGIIGAGAAGVTGATSGGGSSAFSGVSNFLSRIGKLGGSGSSFGNGFSNGVVDAHALDFSVFTNPDAQLSEKFGAAATYAAAGAGAYQGISTALKGDAKNVFAGIGETLGSIAAFTGPAAPIIGAVAATAGLVASILPDQKQEVAKLEARQTFAQQYLAPPSEQVSEGANGGYADVGINGQVRQSNLSPYPVVAGGYLDVPRRTVVPGRVISQFGGYENIPGALYTPQPPQTIAPPPAPVAPPAPPEIHLHVHAIDTQNIVDRSSDILDAFHIGIQKAGHPVIGTLQTQLGLR